MIKRWLWHRTMGRLGRTCFCSCLQIGGNQTKNLTKNTCRIVGSKTLHMGFPWLPQESGWRFSWKKLGCVSSHVECYDGRGTSVSEPCWILNPKRLFVVWNCQNWRKTPENSWHSEYDPQTNCSLNSRRLNRLNKLHAFQQGTYTSGYCSYFSEHNPIHGYSCSLNLWLCETRTQCH